MKKIYDVNVRMTISGKMVVVVRFIENNNLKTKIEPFSEELLLKYKKKYEKQKAMELKIKNRIKEKTENDTIEINTRFFIDNVLTNGIIVLEIAGIAAALFIGAKAVFGILDDFNKIESPIIPDEEIEYDIDMHK